MWAAAFTSHKHCTYPAASHLVIRGSMNFDQKSKQLNNMNYSSVQVIQVRAESKALI